LIITENSYYSFATSGLLKDLEASIKYVPAFELKRRYEEGIAESKRAVKKAGQDKMKEIAKALKLKGVDIDTIISTTGLSKTVVNGLKI